MANGTRESRTSGRPSITFKHSSRPSDDDDDREWTSAPTRRSEAAASPSASPDFSEGWFDAEGDLDDDELDAPLDGARYANVAVRDAKGHRPRFASLGDVVSIEVSIASLRSDSDVADPIPFPDDLLPRDDLWLDVLLSSADLDLGRPADVLGEATAVEARLLLPADGGPALTEHDDELLVFALRLPRKPGHARARLTYLYNNVAVQSQRIDIDTLSLVGNTADFSIRVTTDYTLSRTLGPELADLTRRNRVTVVMNDSGGQHHVTVRAATQPRPTARPARGVLARRWHREQHRART